MPLIDITLNPKYCIRQSRGNARPDKHFTSRLVKHSFARALPDLLVQHAGALGLDDGTPPEGVQVMNHNYGPDDVNTANIWVKIQLSEARPDDVEECWRIRDLFYNLMVEWFTIYGFRLDNFVMDLFWGPTHGKGTVNGVDIAW